jgi:hypothetical protein
MEESEGDEVEVDEEVGRRNMWCRLKRSMFNSAIDSGNTW